MNPTHRASAPSEVTPAPRVVKNPLLETLLQLRDEIRLHMHLASMDAKDQWQVLERELYSASDLVHRDKVDRNVVLHELRIRVERFARSLRQELHH